MSDCDHYGFDAVTIRMQERLAGRDVPCPWCDNERLRRELAEARKLLSDRCLFIVPDEDWQDRRDAFLASDQPPAVKPQHQCVYCAMGVARFENSRGQWIHEFDDGTRVECTADKSTSGTVNK